MYLLVENGKNIFDKDNGLAIFGTIIPFYIILIAFLSVAAIGIITYVFSMWVSKNRFNSQVSEEEMQLKIKKNQEHDNIDHEISTIVNERKMKKIEKEKELKE